MTTGHEWNGIKELNTPVPRAVWFFLIVSFLFALGYWLLMPAWPTGQHLHQGPARQATSAGWYRKGQPGCRGAIGMDQQDRCDWTIDQIRADQALMESVREDGHRLFGDNCAACHGVDATGGTGFPNLTDNDWLWGGNPEAIAQTIKAGINSSDPKRRGSARCWPSAATGCSTMTPFSHVTDYVMSLSDPALARGRTARSVMAGAAVFAANCVVCHGADGRGNQAWARPT